MRAAPHIPLAAGPRRAALAGNGAVRQSAGWWPTDALRWCLVLMMVMTISRVNAHFPVLVAIRPLQILAVLTLALAILNPRLLSRLPWARAWPARLVMALGVVACFSAVFGISLGGSAFFILTNYSKVLLFAFLLMATTRSIRDLHTYIWAYVIAVGVLVATALLQGQMIAAGTAELRRLEGFDTTYDANDVGVVLLVGLALALYTFQMSRAAGKIVSLGIMMATAVTLAKSGSRGALVGMIIFALAALVLVDAVSFIKRLALIVVTGGALMLASPEGYWQQMKTLLTPTEDYNWHSETGRRMVFKRGMGYLATRPVFGVGIANFPKAEGTLSERAINWRPGETGVFWTAPHNSFLQAAVEMGVVGVGVWGALLIVIIWSVLRLGRRMPRSWRTGAFEERVLYTSARYVPLAAITFAASGVFVSFAYLDPIYILAAYAVGITVLSGGSTKGQSRPVPSSRERGGAVLAPPRAAAT